VGINDEAQEIVNAAAEHFAVVTKHLKNLAEDFAITPHELIFNWKELSYSSKNPLGQRLGDAYKKTAAFVQLMELFVHLPEE
jgi:hypothetical protein